MRCRTSLALTALLLLIAPTVSTGQATTTDADAREILAYRLTMPKLTQLNQAMADLYRQRESDPAYQRLRGKQQELARLNEKEEPTDADLQRIDQLEREIAEGDAPEGAEEAQAPSLSDLAARMAADPRIAGALTRAGLAPREAATMQLALFQAGFVVSLLESGTIKEVPKDVNAANVAFYRANRAAIEALGALQPREDD